MEGILMSHARQTSGQGARRARHDINDFDETSPAHDHRVRLVTES